MIESSANAFSTSQLRAGALGASAHSTSSRPAELSDAELLVATRRLVGRSNQLLASLLAHLAEVEARGIHRTRACSSLYVYCVYELRFSEDEAFRRVTAARLVCRFPALLDAVAAGELHLTGLLMLGPHLTAENFVEVLARAKHRTKKEIARLVRVLDPLPDVPPCVEPLGPAPARRAPLAVSTPTWRQFVDAMEPVRELTAGDRPRDWMDSAAERNDGEWDRINVNGGRDGVSGDDMRNVDAADLGLASRGAVSQDAAPAAAHAAALQGAVHGQRGAREARRASEGSSLSFGSACRP
jgi:hypothetical protein